MTGFRKLLLAIDLSPETELLIARVLDLCLSDLHRLHVVHVIKSGLHDSEISGSKWQLNPQARRMGDHIKIRIRETFNRFGLSIADERIHLLHGEPAFEIKKLAAEMDADLVIVGSHTKQDDWMQLPGATTNCVIQGISSDVMAVKI